ncbi:hypothetical protein [Methanobrevibacter sp.]|uniref:hypothetical protein n=1 Tax=Methanobrevibacter sp. TaxID=66852 RepID=UPI003890534E
MFSKVMISRLDELIGEFDTPFFNYLLYSYDLDLYDCELIISKIRNDINEEIISSDDNLVEVVEDYFEARRMEGEKQDKIEYLALLMSEDDEFYIKFLNRYTVSPGDRDMIYDKVRTAILKDNISDFEIRRSLQYYFSNAVKQESYVRTLKLLVGDSYDSLTVKSVKRQYPNIHDEDIYRISNEMYSQILDSHDFANIKSAFFDKVMRRSEAKKAEAIEKWDNLVLGNGDSFNRLLESKNLTLDDGERIKVDVRTRILNGGICADRIDGVFLTMICNDYGREKHEGK